MQIPAQPLTTADEELDDLDHDLSVDDLSDRVVEPYRDSILEQTLSIVYCI